MKLDLLDRSVVERISDSEVPIHYFYLPVIRNFYLRRFEMIFELMGNEKYEKLIEIGYGTGIMFPELAIRARSLHATEIKDSSSILTDHLKSRNIDVTFTSGSICKLPYESNQFDCIVSVSVLEHIHELDSAMKEMRRILKPGGTAFFGFPAKNACMNGFFRISGYDPDKIHPNSDKFILKKAAEHFHVASVNKLSFVIPLYVACKCIKK